MILLTFCMVEMKTALGLARFRVISLSVHHFSKFSRSAMMRFTMTEREALAAVVVASSANKSKSQKLIGSGKST